MMLRWFLLLTFLTMTPLWAIADFQERSDAMREMIEGYMAKIQDEEIADPEEKRIRILKEYMILLSQLKFYIITFGPHDSDTTVKEIKKFRRIVEREVDKHVKEAKGEKPDEDE